MLQVLFINSEKALKDLWDVIKKSRTPPIDKIAEGKGDF